jgi:hypothetical protein
VQQPDVEQAGRVCLAIRAGRRRARLEMLRRSATASSD